MDNKESEKSKMPWPTKAAMEQVYALNLWGGNTADFYSGEGSHNPELLHPYLEVITSFLTSFNEPITVCDLGCGDFNVGKELVRHTKNYIAIDVVPSLIVHNKNKFKQENLEFLCLDIAVDKLPSGDCVLLRQVLQHLSNTEVDAVLRKLTSFKYIVLTEHLPEGNFLPNKDIISGQGIRLKKQSGISLTAPPFNFKVGSEKQLLSVNLSNGKGVIVTTLYTLF
jgi:hypothetical protein